MLDVKFKSKISSRNCFMMHIYWKISIDKSRLVDYDSFSWREYDIYTLLDVSIGQENEHKSGFRRKHKWGQGPKSFFIELILSLKVEKINMVIKKRNYEFIWRWKKIYCVYNTR